MLQEPSLFKHKNDEFGRGIPIKTSANTKHNKPNMIIWKHNDRQSAIIEFSCPAYVNIEKKIKEKIDWNTNQKFTNDELEL